MDSSELKCLGEVSKNLFGRVPGPDQEMREAVAEEPRNRFVLTLKGKHLTS